MEWMATYMGRIVTMLDDFFVRAIIGGIGVALAAGPLGSFIVWKRMAFFGDALAHSALLGVALGFALGINQVFGVVLVAALFSVVIVSLQKQRSYSSDTLLGIMAHSSLALGLVVVSFIDKVRVDLMSFLFGDILAIGVNDIVFIYVGALGSIAILATMWRPLLLSTLNQDLAKVEGVNVDLVRFKFMLLVSLLVALSIKIVGIMLVTSLLIIPAATARKFSHTPERMAVVAGFIGVLSVISGLFLSLHFDTPSGPSIVVSSLGLFVVSSFFRMS
jgi:zinc transport system permease protein